VFVLLASSALTVFATLRTVWPLFTQRKQALETGEIKIVPYLCAAVVVGLVILAILVGVFPQFVADPLIAALGNASYLK